jgi:hypothetical protein
MTKTYVPHKEHLGLETLVNKVDPALQAITYARLGNRTYLRL